MNALILDSSIIIKYPRIVSIKIPDTDIFTTPEILDEIGYSSDNSKSGISSSNLLDLIQNAIDENNLVVHRVKQVSEEPGVGTFSIADKDSSYKTFRLSYADRSLITLGNEISHAYNTVSIATQDIEIVKAALELKFNIVTAKELQDLIKATKRSNSSLERKVNEYEKSINNKFILGIFIGMLVTLLVFTLYFNFKTIVKTINIWGTITLIILLAISLFVFREKRRFSYGIFEFLSGIAAIILIFYPAFDYSKINYSFDFYVKSLAGLYVMVRGLDNIIKSLQGKKWGIWIKEKTGIG